MPPTHRACTAVFAEGLRAGCDAEVREAHLKALVSFYLPQSRAPFAIPAVWTFNTLGPFGWIVMTICLPAWWVSHTAIFFALQQPQPLP